MGIILKCSSDEISVLKYISCDGFPIVREESVMVQVVELFCLYETVLEDKGVKNDK